MWVALAVGSTPLAGQNAESPGAAVGDWRGVLDVGAAQLTIVFHIVEEDGGLLVTMDSPDQGAFGIPVPEVDIAPPNVDLAIPAIQGRYEGLLNASGDTIEGRWTQGPNSLPLQLTRGDVAPPIRPQEPSEPFPYTVEKVRFASVAEGVTLAGALTIPEGPGPWPAAILVSGSGPQDRDESLLGHKPFLVLSDHLTREGIAVLRFDDRGVGESTGDFASATSEDFALDAEGAFAFLAGREEIAGDRIGVVGHSEGGLIAPMVANALSGDLGYIVLLAGPGIDGASILALQNRLILEAEGTPIHIADLAVDHLERTVEVIRTHGTEGGLAEAVRSNFTTMIAELTDEEREALQYSDERVEQQVAQLATPWFRFFLTYDPAPALRRVKLPVLAINGTKDLQVPADVNLAAIEAALREGGNSDFEVRSLPDLNHLFQTAKTGAPSEYQRIEETFAPLALEVVSAWILERFARPVS